VRGILARRLHTTAVPTWWLAAAAAIFVVLLVLAVRLHRDGHEARAITVMAVAMLCASPISWSHHWVWCALILICSIEVATASRRRLDIAVAVTVMLPFALGLVFWTPHGDGRELTDSGSQQVLAASYVIAGLGFAAWMALVRRRPTVMMPTWPATTISADPPSTAPEPLTVG
jgi:alpha-1,2-mannosyltransferase